MGASLHDGMAVSVCCSVRVTDRAHEAGVETHPEFRGRGHATRAVAEWAAAVWQLRCVPLYSTSWENASSRALARRLGLVQFGADLHIA
jgi:predicted GNAT family acetyltransferase